jgi:hypothetical protein
MQKRQCNWHGCDILFVPRRKDQQFCSAECRSSHNNWSSRHLTPEKKRASDREYRKKYADELKQRRRNRSLESRAAKEIRDRIGSVKRRKKIRDALIAHFGGKCARCEFADWRALQLDHVNGSGTKEHGDKKSVTSFYQAAMATKPGEKYQLLCANCNQIKRYEQNEGCGANSQTRRQKY